MKTDTSTCEIRGKRIRSALLVFCAVVLFLAGLLLLFAPGPGQSEQSQLRRVHFRSGENGRIMGWQSRVPTSLAGG